MSTNHAAVAALPISAPASQTLVRNLLVGRMPYVLADADNPTDLVAVDPSTGAAIVDITYLGRLFHYDPTDMSTANDGVTCLVSNEGRRFKLANNTDVAVWGVLSKTPTAPPGSPSNGDSYLVPAGATGAWAGKGGYVAVKTARGWEFVLFGIGRLLYVEDIDTYYRRNAAGVWTAGLGAAALAAGSVTLQNVLGANASFVIKVENQTTNAPPGSPAAPTAYIIGPAPTGSWAASAGKLAICLTTGSFTIITPVAGDVVHDKALGVQYQFNGAAWISLQRGMLDSKIGANTPSTAGWSTQGSGAYNSGSYVAPTTSFASQEDPRTMSFAAKAAGNKLVFHYSAEFFASSAGEFVFAIFRDSLASADDWRRVTISTSTTTLMMQFTSVAPDTSSHVYKIRGIAVSAGGAGGGLTPAASRLFRVEEYVS